MTQVARANARPAHHRHLTRRPQDLVGKTSPTAKWRIAAQIGASLRRLVRPDMSTVFERLNHSAEALAEVRLDVAMSLERVEPLAQEVAIRFAVDASGGAIIAPALGWGPHEWTICLLGVSVNGISFPEAIQAWIKAALRMAADPAPSCDTSHRPQLDGIAL